MPDKDISLPNPLEEPAKVDETPKTENKGRTPKILIAVPCQEMVNVNFVTSLMHLERPPQSSVVFTQSSILPQSRDTLASIAITNGFTHILFIDSDMTFPSDALNRLYNRNVDIVTGLCFARKGNHNPCIYKRINYENPVKGVENGNIDVEEDIYRDFFEVKACGMAFCLIKTDVLIKISSENDGSLFQYIASFGEDLSFCIRALKAGYKIYCDTTFPIGHIGEHQFGKADWEFTRKYNKAKELAAKAAEEAKQKKDEVEEHKDVVDQISDEYIENKFDSKEE